MRIFFIALFTTLAFAQLNAQSYVLSPYSRYGLGELQTNTEPISFSMGGLSSAVRNRFGVNSFNPASLTTITRDADSLPMVFNGGIKGNYSGLRNTTGNSNRLSGSLNSFAYGFKAARNWGIAFGLQPYSSVGYTLSTDVALDTVSDYTAKYDGSGGFNKFWIGQGILLFDHLSIGFNASYVFGSLSQTRRIVFDTTLYYNAKTISSRYVGDFAFDAGFQYEMMLKHDTLKSKYSNSKLVLGGTIGLPSELDARETMMAFRYYTSSGSEIIVDTTAVSNDEIGKVTLPLSLSGGFVFSIDRKGKKSNESKGDRTAKWTVGMDYKMQNWSDYSAFGVSDSLRNSFSVNAGFSVTPKSVATARYIEKMTWYGGLHYDQTYLNLKGQTLSKVGISFGCSFPLKSVYPRLQRSVITTGVEFGKMGTTDQNLIEEKYIRFVVGVSLMERWFEKKKYN